MSILKFPKLILAISGLIASSLLPGCGGTNNGPPPAPDGATPAVIQLRDILVMASTGAGDPLKNKASVKSYEGDFPDAAAAINEGKIKIIYGRTVKDGAPSNEIIAYETSAESGEGWAIKDDGKIHRVTSTDISSLPKTK